MVQTIPASLKRYAKYIEDIEDYRAQGPDGDGYWIHLKPGWINTFTETHSIHEDNISQCLPQFQYIKHCTCDQCKKVTFYLNKRIL
jgi:hypothetical protein